MDPKAEVKAVIAMWHVSGTLMCAKDGSLNFSSFPFLCGESFWAWTLWHLSETQETGLIITMTLAGVYPWCPNWSCWKWCSVLSFRGLFVGPWGVVAEQVPVPVAQQCSMGEGWEHKLYNLWTPRPGVAQPWKCHPWASQFCCCIQALLTVFFSLFCRKRNLRRLQCTVAFLFLSGSFIPHVCCEKLWGYPVILWWWCRWKTGCPLTSEFQINNKLLFSVCPMQYFIC